MTAVRTARGVLAMIVAVVAVGCGTTTEDPAAGSPADSLGKDSLQEMKLDEQTAVKAVDAFWSRHFPEELGREYRSPQVYGRYRGTDGPPCAGEPSVPFNAFYCRPGDFLAWDEDLMAAGYSQIGDAWVYLIIAHEWGHAIQARMGADRVSVQAELQADCLAGAALQGAAEDGIIEVEPGDSEEIAQTLAAVADEFPWTNESDHGNAQERTAAFNTGTSGGVAACI